MESKHSLSNPVTLVITDLDGTLLDENKQVSEKTREALKELKNRGILFGIASGRPVESSQILCKDWGLQDSISFMVGMNGGTIVDTRTREKQNFNQIHGETILEIVQHFKKLGKNLHYEVMDGNNRFVEFSTQETIDNADLYGENEIIVDFKSFLPKRKFNKLVIRSAPEEQQELIEHARLYENRRVRAFPTANNLFEYVDPAINKGFGLQKILEHFGLDREHVVAFGDEANDLEMIELAGTGVAMGNAVPIVKEKADVVLEKDANHDGLADYVLDVILPSSPERLDKPL